MTTAALATTPTPALTAQQWVEEEVKKCKNDEERGLWNARQCKGPTNVRILLRRWKHLNDVIGTPTADTYMMAAIIGSVVALVIMVVLGWAAYSQLKFAGFAVSGGVGVLMGLVVGYNKFVNMVFRETYIEVIVDEYQSKFQAAHEALDVVVAFLPRLGFILRPEVFEGNRGETGFRDPKARIRLQTRFGQSIHDLVNVSDYWDLPANTNCLDQGANMERYSIEALVRAAGTLYRLHGVPKAAESPMNLLSGNWHWIVLVVGMGVSVFIVAQ